MRVLLLEQSEGPSIPENIHFPGHDIIRNSKVSGILDIMHYDVMLTNFPSYSVFKAIKNTKPNCITILFTSLPMIQYSLALQSEEKSLVDHTISSEFGESNSLKQIVNTLSKLLTITPFEISSYLLPGTEVTSLLLRGASDRESIHIQLASFLNQKSINPAIARRFKALSEEMMMNAFFDAPMAAGIPRFQNIDSLSEIVLESHEFCKIHWGYDDQSLVLSCEDPFGSLDRETFLLYLSKVLIKDQDVDMRTPKAGGAGLGLLKILESCHSLTAVVSPGKTTEVTAQFFNGYLLKNMAKIPRSIHFFKTRG